LHLPRGPRIVVVVLEASRPSRLLRSRAVAIQRFGGAGDVTRGALLCGAWLGVIAAAVRVAMLAFESGGLVIAIPLGMIAVMLFLVGFFCTLAAPLLWLSALLARRRPGALEVGEALFIDQRGERSVQPLLSVVGAHLSPTEDELTLRTREGDLIRAAVDSESDAEALLSALAGGTIRGTWLATLYNPDDPPRWIASSWISAAVAFVFALLFSIFLMEPDAAISLAVLAAAGVKAAAFLLRKPEVRGSVVVGRDGLAIRENEAERFVAFGAIAEVEEIEGGVGLSLRSGDQLRLVLRPRRALDPAGTLPLTLVLADKRRAEMLARVGAELRQSPVEPPRAGTLLERKGRSVSAWREGLRTLLSEAGDYRKAMLSREQAAQVLEDGHANGELRIGAALALTLPLTPAKEGANSEGPRVPRVDRQTAERLRIAVETCVDQEVRIALRQAIYGELDEETLERAMKADARRA
jgi:hypothetical protein